MDDCQTPGSVPLAVLLFVGALAIFTLGYLPEARKAQECERLVTEARRRISELSREEELTRRRIAELDAGVPEAVEEAAREVLRLGAPVDFLPADR